ncbi:hypothetical protein ASZ90_008026 [hydrocarbon metagenome]|uniref:Uncharacterized protein n=1 Tax=hydrocarbon metagenome TaxID=938273 RepID=A0A0W8FNI7_9ZZZZ
MNYFIDKKHSCSIPPLKGGKQRKGKNRGLEGWKVRRLED